jgi:hypothetical protein
MGFSNEAMRSSVTLHFRANAEGIREGTTRVGSANETWHLLDLLIFLLTNPDF